MCGPSTVKCKVTEKSFEVFNQLQRVAQLNGWEDLGSILFKCLLEHEHKVKKTSPSATVKKVFSAVCKEKEEGRSCSRDESSRLAVDNTVKFR